MATEDSVTDFIVGVKAGDADSLRRLWERYYSRLVLLARQRLRKGSKTAGGEEEDVALSAFNSFWDGAQLGRFPQLDDRDNLWKILVRITKCKAFKRVRSERTSKRGGGKVRPITDLIDADADPRDAFEHLLGQEPSPAFAAMVAEEYRNLLDRLGDDRLRAIAVAKLEGYTNEELADRFHCARQTITRKLEIIRKRWRADEAALDAESPCDPES
ncbi:MAG TPA: ECF-type sigma factor [Isosphaeraceae bacterium]|jgi:DNA-directed RNA polymerase specialized sigma24 family protein|nr:ECF-type sigma factor [Isosphaeraceae bacterium]